MPKTACHNVPYLTLRLYNMLPHTFDLLYSNELQGISNTDSNFLTKEKKESF